MHAVRMYVCMIEPELQVATGVIPRGCLGHPYNARRRKEAHQTREYKDPDVSQTAHEQARPPRRTLADAAVARPAR